MYFKNCTLQFKAGDSAIFSAKQEFNATTGTVLSLDSKLNLSQISGNFSISRELADSNRNDLADELEPETKFEKVVIIVLEGDNLFPSSLTLSPYLKLNFQKLHEGIKEFNPEKVKFVVIWDGDRANGFNGESDLIIVDPIIDLRNLELRISNILTNKYLSLEDSKAGIIYWNYSSDNLSNHLQKLLEIIAKAYPAEKYDLIISDHGDGWLSEPTPTTRTVLYESAQEAVERGTTWLGTKQFAQILKDLKQKGINFELIGFDECLMGELVSLSAIAPYAQVLIASPSFEPGMGWGDEVWYNMPKWYKDNRNTFNIAKNIVNGYIDYYKNNYYSSAVITLTAVTSKAILALKNSFDKFAYGLLKTAQNEISSGRMREVFFWDLSYEINDSCYKTMWVSPEVFNHYWDDSILVKLTEPIEELINQSIFFAGYGDFSANSESSLGSDLLYLVSGTGATARVYQLGYSPFDFPTSYTLKGEPVKPNFYYGIINASMDFIKTYELIKESGEIYTVYLGLDNGYTYPVTGSGIAITYPYTCYLEAEEPRLTFSTYKYFTKFYKDDFPNYSNFVQTIFEEGIPSKERANY